VPFVRKVRLKYGPAVTLIDVSTGGAQFETRNRLQPGSAIIIEMAGTDSDLAIPAQVIRCQLVSLIPEATYRSAVSFKRPLDFKDLTPASAVEPPRPLDPAVEQRQLRLTLSRLDLGDAAADGGAQTEPDDAASWYEALDAAMATLETAAGRRAGPALSGELAAMFKAMAAAIAEGPTPAALVAALREHLREVIGARAIHLVESDSRVPPSSAEAILFAIPALGQGGKARAAIEFADGCEPEEAHFQLLKAGMQLVALARQLGRVNGFDAPLKMCEAVRLPQGWSRVVIRRANGRLHKGYTHDFLPAKGFIHVQAEPKASERRLSIPFGDLKAIFFVKDLDGNPGYAEDRTLDPSAKGRKIWIRFRDGEEIVGTTFSYSSGAPGFFLQPADPKSNNDRVFVIATAIAAHRFL
jgi:hypothetical protein